MKKLFSAIIATAALGLLAGGVSAQTVRIMQPSMMTIGGTSKTIWPYQTKKPTGLRSRFSYKEMSGQTKWPI